MRDTWPGHDLVFNLGLLSKVSKNFARFLEAADAQIFKLKYIYLFLNIFIKKTIERIIMLR